MTENQWPQDGSFGAAPVPQQTALRDDPAYSPAPQGTASKTDVAKDEAGDVASQAAESAQNVAETAKTEVANVAAEVTTNARDLLLQAKSDLAEQAGAQQQKVAQGLRSISDELQSMAATSDQPGVATDLVRQAAERSASVASWLDGRDPGSLLDEVKSFARQRPGTFLLLAAGAGVLAGRLSRSLSAGAPETRAGTPATATPTARVPGLGGAVPPPPVQLPGPDITTAGMAGTYPPNPLGDAGTPRDPRADDPLAGDRIPESPLSGRRPDEDPYRDDPFAGERR